MVIKIKITKEMKRKFHNETADHLEQFERMLVTLEKDTDDHESIHGAFRAIHSIKGNTDYIGFSDINQLSHELEELMDDVRTQTLPMNRALFSVLFMGLELLRKMNQNILSDNYQESDISEIVQAIQKLKLLSMEKSAPVPESGFKKKPLDVKGVFASSASQHVEQIKQALQKLIEHNFTPNDQNHLNRILDTFHKSAAYVNAREIVQNIESIQGSLKNEDEKTQPIIEQSIQKIEAILATQFVPSAEKKKEKKAQPINLADEFSDVIGHEIRVDLEKLDLFMNQILSLSIEKNQMVLHAKTLDTYFQNDFKSKFLRNTLKQSIDRVAKLSDTLKKAVLKLRLLKMKTLFERLPAMIRKLSEQSGKRVELTITGDDIEVDRKVIEVLIDPLIHMTRNALDHGIEDAEARLSKGKPEAGQINISAHQEGNHVTITFSDDGQGLDVERIRRKAAQKKLLPENQLDNMTDNEIGNLIFMPGFSTTDKVTVISGRGVGLDVVNHHLKSIGGNVTMSYEKGVYTRFHLTVPINIAITEVLLTELNDDIYGFPFSAILETLWIYPKDIQLINNQETISYKENILLVKSLADIMSLNSTTALRTKNEKEKIQVIVIAFGSQLLGVAVDRIITSEGVLNKPLGHHLEQITEFSSAAMLGDGRIVLIINPAGIVKETNK